MNSTTHTTGVCEGSVKGRTEGLQAGRRAGGDAERDAGGVYENEGERSRSMSGKHDRLTEHETGVFDHLEEVMRSNTCAPHAEQVY